ncbi:MAG: MBL fold metallo-hydrolase [Gammaproteobacteria bacterium]|nr:MBL fold metallo-hydrolase [Gammaproteobacteria bacterium]
MTALTFPWSAGPAPGEVRAIRPGFAWVRMPLPFALDHVNLWLLDDGDKTFIVDTSVASGDTTNTWRAVLSTLTRPPSRLLATHYHPDHIGLAGWLARTYDVEVIISKTEWARAGAALSLSDEGFVAQQAALYRKHGLDESRIDSLEPFGNSYLPLVDTLPEQVTHLQDGDTLSISGDDWDVITVGGHAPEMVCLYSATQNILIAADQILPSITPNISLSFYTTEADPLGSFLHSFSRFSELPEDVLVLPSHGLPFHGMHARIQQLISHHEQRLDALIAACETPQTAESVLHILFRRELGAEQLMFAMGESIAHLRHLELQGAISCNQDNGVNYYTVS